MAGPQRQRSRGLLLWAQIFTLVSVASGSHFRYGTLSWQALTSTIVDTGGLKKEVEMTLQAAYRRDYEWGQNFGEQWKQLSSVQSSSIWYGNEKVNNVFDATNAGCNPAVPTKECYECPFATAGVDDSGLRALDAGCVNTAPRLDVGTGDSNSNGIVGEKFFIRFPRLRQGAGAGNANIVQCASPFTCDIRTVGGTDNTAQRDLCGFYQDNAARDPAKCAPWDLVYGMFTGDEVGNGIDVEFEVTSIDEDANSGTGVRSAIGNFVTGQAKFTHFYYVDKAKPYLAHFSGGDRVYECGGGLSTMNNLGQCQNTLRLQLNNNAEGRFRLEMEIWLKSGIENRSPRITMIPIVPVPRALSGSRSRFQVAAYDPDGDDLRYRFGSTLEYGGIMRSKTEAFPFSSNQGGIQLGGLNGGFVYGPFACDTNSKSITNTGFCPTDRIPRQPLGTITHSFKEADNGGVVPGLIEWETFDTPPMDTDDWCPKIGASCTKLREGLYNFVVMVEDIPITSDYFQSGTSPSGNPADHYKSKVPVDFMAYLYDGPMYYCDSACTSAAGVATYANLNGIYDSCAICGMGPLAAFNSTVCAAGASVGSCAQLASDGVSLVPPTDACKLNQAPVFISVNGKENNTIDTPEVIKWTTAHEAILNAGLGDVDLDVFEYPQISQYYGAAVQFYVTAVDFDECTALTLESTGLPETFSSAPGDWRRARLDEYIYPTHGNTGTMVRRLFTWEAPPGAVLNAGLDNRDAQTLVCFTAYDVYFATADPFYCVMINLREKPAAEEETLLRFECKMALLWSPVVNRFVFADAEKKYYTVCRYEDYVWHHALVALDEDGVGQLYVDGVAQELMVPRDITDLSVGFNPAAGNTVFETTIFPTSCVGGGVRRRTLLQEDGEADVGADSMSSMRKTLGLTYNPDRMGLNDFSDQPVNDTFADYDPATNPGLTCCNFRIGRKCESGDTNEYRSFAGLIDEVAVWNRLLRPEEVKSTLFKMPQHQTERQLEGPRGVQIDYTTGRVMYARFNNPCMESPEQAPPPPAPPPPPCANEGCTRRRLLMATIEEEANPEDNQDLKRRRLQQISNHEISLNLPGGDRDPITQKYSPPPPDGTPGGDGPNLGRRDYIKDESMLTAGLRFANGTMRMIDPSDLAKTVETGSWLEKKENRASLNIDAAQLIDFPFNSKYAYTGVPWLAPMVTQVTSTSMTSESSLDSSSPLPLDGGIEVHVHGIGFARSAFTKCVLVQPDPAGLYERPEEYINPDVEMSKCGDDQACLYNNYYRGRAGAMTMPLDAYSLSEGTTQVMKTQAEAVFMKGLNIPWIHNYDEHTDQPSFTPESAWDVENIDTRGGAIPAFQADRYDSHNLDFIFGGWEVLKCKLPPAAFPSDKYILGVSNDAGLTGSPPTAETSFMDYSVALAGDSSFSMDTIRAQLGNVFSVSAWVYPTFEPSSTASSDRQFVLELGGTESTGIIFDGTLKAVLANSLQSPSANTSAVNMWHFVMIVIDGSRASFYLDGSDEFSFGGGGSSRTWAGFNAAGPPKMQFGAGFFGLMDEIKMYRRAVSHTELIANDMMYTRGLPENTFAYYRFNQLTEYIDPTDKVINDEFQQYDGVVDGGAMEYEYLAMAVPWEPSSVYTINGEDVAEKFKIHSYPQTGMTGELTIEGFNIAKSFNTGCNWGAEREMPATAFTVEDEATPGPCTIPEPEALDVNSGDATETFSYSVGSMGRIDGRKALMLPYPVSAVSSSVAFVSATAISDDGMTMTCPSASVPKPQFALFSAGSGPSLNAVPFEFTEVALGCTGDNYIDASEVNKGIGGRAYTMAAWAMPAVMDPDAPAMSRRRARSLLSVDKNLRRRKLLSHGGGHVATTLLAFEGEDGKNDALVMYDGERFFYYDDCILDVTQTGMPAAAGEWHYVAVSVDAEGNGILNVDGVVQEMFTTTCRPKTTGTFSMCQDFNAAGEASSFFMGHVDEVKIWDREMPYEMMSSYMFEPYDFETANPVAHFPFADSNNMLPNFAVAVGGTNWVKASGPWIPATVVGVKPEMTGVAGGMPVTVYGTNFAKSAFLRVSFGSEGIVPDKYVDNGIIATIPVPTEFDCGDQRVVTVHNLPMADMLAYNAYFNSTYTDVVVGDDVDYDATVEGLGHSIFARFTFDFTSTATIVDGDYAVSFDLSGASGSRADLMTDNLTSDAVIPSNPVIPGTTHFWMPLAAAVPDKDQFEKGAVMFGEDFSVPIPMPTSKEYTIAAWLFMEASDEFPVGFGWKLVSMVHMEDGSSMVHINGKVMDATVSQFINVMLSDFVIGGPTEVGHIDELWVWSRALLECELVALYYTQEYALDFVKGGDRMMSNPAHLMLPIPAGPLRFTMSMWIYPFKTEGIQTLASSDGARYFDTENRDLGLAFGLNDNALTFDIHKGCSCQPCPGVITMTSWKSIVKPFEWTYVSFLFPYGEEFPTMERTTMAIHVDGILRDLKEIPDVVIPEVAEAFEMPLLLGQHSTDELNFLPFAGMLYDVRFTHSSSYNFNIKKSMQCPPKVRDESDVYFELNVGSGALASTGGAMGLSGLWTNTSYDDPTSAASTTFQGDMVSKMSGDVGRFVITSRTSCQKKRVVGGDAYTVTMTHPNGQVDTLPIVDTNDGNYHVSYSDLMCGDYATSVSLNGEQLNTFDVKIFPGATDPSRTFIVDQLPEASCFGTVTEFEIQAQDTYGCPQDGHNDTFMAMLDGPSKVTALVTPVPTVEGRYRVSFVPEAPGNYHLTLWMVDPVTHEARQIMDGMYFCMDVCAEGSLELATDTGVVVNEDLPGVSDLDLSFPGITMEMWFKLPAGTSFPRGANDTMYLLHKGGTDQQSMYTKTYDLLIKPSGEIMASVYIGLAEIRTVKLPASDAMNYLEAEQWIHVAAVYSGFRFVIYMNGELAAAEPAPSTNMLWDPKPVKTNLYFHPLEIGAGMAGAKIDEVKLWKVARTAEQVADAMYCAPYQNLEDVAAYFSFSEGTGAVTSGHGAQCDHRLATAHFGNCLQGALTGDAFFTADSPVGTPTEGYNAPSAKYSMLFGPGLSIYPAGSLDFMYTVVAKDKCNYAYTKVSPTSFGARTANYNIEYVNFEPPNGQEFPIMTAGNFSDAVFAIPPVSRQCPGDATPGPYKGDIYNGPFAVQGTMPTTQAGSYLLELAVDGVPTGPPMLITVVANEPDHFDVVMEFVEQGLYAGVPGVFKVQMKDAHDNTIYTEMSLDAQVSLLASLEGTPSEYSSAHQGRVMSFDADDGFYTVAFRLGYPGTYSLLLSGTEGAMGMTSLSMSFTVNAASWHSMLTNNLEVPDATRRFEHTSAMHDHNMYIFGGALYDRTYLNDMWSIKIGHDAEEGSSFLAFKETLMFEYTIEMEKDLTVEVRVNTKAWIAAGKMNPSCLDVVFTLPGNSDNLDFYLDPHPGCDSEETLYWVKFPAGSVSPDAHLQLIDMFYGNPFMGVVTENEHNNPKSVFFMYEGFDAITTGDRLIFEPGETACHAAAETNAAETFVVDFSNVFHGSGSMSVAWGNTGMLVWKSPMPVHGFKLRAWFYDSDATNSTHFISPDFTECDAVEGDKTVLPMAHGPLEAVSTAVGTYTLAHTSKYCVASPWESATANAADGTKTAFRSAGWHQFEVLSAYGRLVVSIDGEPVKNVSSASGETTLEHVMLSAGFTAEQVAQDGQNSNHAFWDEISVVLVEDGVGAVSNAGEEVQMVDRVDDRMWTKVNATNPPPPRYAHSSVVFEDKMYIFGGERSAYAFNDVWVFSFATAEWEFVTPVTGPAPEGRYDHTAAVTASGMMIIYGGRNGGKIMGDMWSFDLLTHTWALVRAAEDVNAAPRFGHSAAIPENSADMYVFGGYVDGMFSGFSGEFLRCQLSTGICTNLTAGCETIEVSTGVPEALSARYEHTAFADDRFVYVYGGATLFAPQGFTKVFKFAVAECVWEEIAISGLPVGRYEHTAGLVEGGMYVHGGHANGDFVDDTYFFPL